MSSHDIFHCVPDGTIADILGDSKPEPLNKERLTAELVALEEKERKAGCLTSAQKAQMVFLEMVRAKLFGKR